MDQSKDIVQDFYIRYWEKYQGKEQPKNFEAFAYVAVKNRSLNQLESNEVRQRREQLSLDTLYEDMSMGDVENNMKEDLRLQLVKAISELPDARRKVFMLSASEGLKYTDIADQLGISINTVKTQIRKAYGQIRKTCSKAVVLLLMCLIICSQHSSLVSKYL